MQKSIYILTAIIAALLVLSGLLFFVAPRNSLRNDLALASEPFNTSRNATTSLPVLLLIPKLGIKAKVENVGITKGGEMDTPENPADVGWYEYGAAPGQIGNAVVAGHLDDALGLPAVFIKLDLLSAGDDIYIIEQNGTRLHFRVIRKQIYDYNIKDTSQIFGPATTTDLNLITCNGSWLPSAQSYNKRLVVFTALLPQ